MASLLTMLRGGLLASAQIAPTLSRGYAMRIYPRREGDQGSEAPGGGGGAPAARRRQAQQARRRAVRDLAEYTALDVPHEMNPNVPAPARDHNDYTQVMERAYDISLEHASSPCPPGEVAVANGVPPDLRERAVTIVAAGRSRMRNSPKWNIRFNPLEKWMNPVTGWTSTGDPMEACPEAAMWFYSPEEAARFCERQGWGYTIEAENHPKIERQRRFAGYGDNFTVKRGGVPDLTHLPSNAAAKGEPGPAAAQAAGRPEADETAVTGRLGPRERAGRG